MNIEYFSKYSVVCIFINLLYWDVCLAVRYLRSLRHQSVSSAFFSETFLFFLGFKVFLEEYESIGLKRLKQF